MGYPPWHMWGNTQTLSLTAQASAQPPTPVTQQLARVSYARPETWRFFFWGELLQSTLAGAGGGINLSFDLIIGIGRASKKIPAFVQLGFPIVGTPATDNVLKWATLAKLPPQFGGDTTERLTDLFIAQDIQCVAQVTFFAASTTSIQLEIGCMFSPNVHLRPEWFADPALARAGIQQFRAGEQGGM